MEDQKNSPLMTAKLILFFVIRTKGHITKTQLVKFLYLADIYSTKWLGKQITNLDWYYYNHGPWQEDIQGLLNNMEGKEITQVSDPSGVILVKLGPSTPDESELELPESMKFMLDNIRREWSGSGKENFKKLLDYVYSTAPMKDVLMNEYSPEDKKPLDLSLEQKQLYQELGV